MYVAEQFAITTTDALAEEAARGVGDLITHGERGIDVTYLPFVLLPDDGGPRRLTTHVARTNQQWQDEGAATWVVHGPDAYISPGWYPAKAEHGKVVPTWNYIAVHARGPVELIEKPERLLQIVSRLSDQHESGRERPWAVSDTPREYLDSMLRAIVGFALPIRRLEGKWKLGQNRSAADQAGVRDGLAASTSPGDRELATRMS